MGRNVPKVSWKSSTFHASATALSRVSWFFSPNLEFIRISPVRRFISPLKVAGVSGGMSSQETFIAETACSSETTPRVSSNLTSDDIVTGVPAGTVLCRSSMSFLASVIVTIPSQQEG